MKPTCTITKDDYRRASVMLNEVTVLAPKGTLLAKAIIENSAAIIRMYEKQRAGTQLGKGAANVLGMHLQYAKLFSDAIQKQRG